MKNILLLTSSPRGEASYSTQVATTLANDLGGNLTKRELWKEVTPPIDPAFVHAIYTPEADRTDEQKSVIAFSDQLVAELKAADVVVIAAGMINFGLPATLKTWIDLITRSGVTFSYGEAGPVGLVTGKKVILVLAAGGVYSSGPMAVMNHLEPTLRTNLGFLGMTDVETVWIEGVLLGPDAAENALSQAKERAHQVVSLVA